MDFKKGGIDMYVVHFYEKNTIVLTQALNAIPAVEQDLRIKGRKGKVVSIENPQENTIHVFVEFEKIVDKSSTASKDLGKKKRR